MNLSQLTEGAYTYRGKCEACNEYVHAVLIIDGYVRDSQLPMSAVCRCSPNGRKIVLKYVDRDVGGDPMAALPHIVERKKRGQQDTHNHA